MMKTASRKNGSYGTQSGKKTLAVCRQHSLGGHTGVETAKSGHSHKRNASGNLPNARSSGKQKSRRSKQNKGMKRRAHGEKTMRPPFLHLWGLFLLP